MDAISSLVASMNRAQGLFDNSAARLASVDLPTATAPDPTNPVAPQPSTNVDVAEQLTTMMVAADAHHLSAAAIRVAFSMYQDAVTMTASASE